ncbi:MarR family winged helix-turn-helix transcriptional regulator [Streptomyces sp. GS7]|uniref:MarR family winged helix-turn-helix transcriptional regulator n=1 Tax=Streptomyces sp. GS7 TaxID=2692234 RepID=UPI00131930C4|nr:MarR family transcriptional regulator [Streptomyces sp. GS7]QHC22784.1 MarR family transcriptional regulator [Streptomyces sp. GS7]
MTSRQPSGSTPADRAADRLPQADDPQFQAFTRAVHDLLGAVRRTRGRLAGQGRPALSLSQIQLLEALADHGGLGVGELAERAGVTAPTATRMLKQLERDGIVTRTRAAGDERRVQVALTDTGAALLSEHRTRLRERQLRAFRELSPDQRAAITELTHRLTQLVDDL